MTELKVACIGDIMMLRRPEARTERFPGTALRSADLAFANLEAPVSDRGYRQDKIIALRMPPESAPALKEMGLHVVSLANNHTLDYGYEALFDTVERVRAQGVQVVGAGASLDEAMAPAIVEVKGRTVACFGFCSAIPFGTSAAADRPGLAPIRVKQTIEADSAAQDEQPGTSPYVHTWALPEDVERAAAAIRKAKAEGHLVLVHIHWGVPSGWMPAFQGWLADYQRPLGHALIDAGADAIYGHHPHVIHGAEVYKGRPIFYSLGNYLFHTQLPGDVPFVIGRPTPPWRMSALSNKEQNESFVVTGRFGPEGFVGAEIRPFILDASAEPAEAPAETARAIMERFVAMSAELGLTVQLAEDGTWGTIHA